eukprot:jgi/Mesen1/3595/ME000020S03122
MGRHLQRRRSMAMREPSSNLTATLQALWERTQQQQEQQQGRAPSSTWGGRPGGEPSDSSERAPDLLFLSSSSPAVSAASAFPSPSPDSHRTASAEDGDGCDRGSGGGGAEDFMRGLDGLSDAFLELDHLLLPQGGVLGAGSTEGEGDGEAGGSGAEGPGESSPEVAGRQGAGGAAAQLSAEEHATQLAFNKVKGECARKGASWPARSDLEEAESSAGGGTTTESAVVLPELTRINSEVSNSSQADFDAFLQAASSAGGDHAPSGSSGQVDEETGVGPQIDSQGRASSGQVKFSEGQDLQGKGYSTSPSPVSELLTRQGDDSMEHQLAGEGLPSGSREESPGREAGPPLMRDDPVELLVEVAKAIVAGDTRATRATLTQLNQVASIYGNAAQRLSAYFLAGLLKRAGGAATEGLDLQAEARAAVVEEEEEEGREGNEEGDAGSNGCSSDKRSLLEAFQALLNASPYLTFGQVAANSAILEAVAGRDSVHIIDFGIACGLQWPALIQALAARPGGPPRVRLTGIDTRTGRQRYCDKTKERLMYVADMWQVPMEFCFIESRLEDVQPAALRLRAGEHTNHNSPFFLARFYEALYYYDALFSALDSALPGDSRERQLYERHVLGRAIVNVVACEGHERVERQEPLSQWQHRMHDAGFRPRPISRSVVTTCSGLLQTYKKGYGLLQEGEGSLTLTWQDKPLLALAVYGTR